MQADILSDLVNQFSDPFSFLRELVQNSIDAGTGEVDVRLEFEADDGATDRGTMTIHVDDFGEGMNREIIEEDFTRLFSSSKDDDYTKIGKFGIGFVSVFAIDPDAVCVDTGRTGESWRVLFDDERTFEVYELERPIEGTKIRILKSVARSEFDDFVDRAEKVLRYWCKHVAVPVYFQGSDIRQEFDIDSSCRVTYSEEGTRIVAGYVDSRAAPFGYYNRGLTLKEGRRAEEMAIEDGVVPGHVAFKIDSRYLEHTLTRDEVVEDGNFDKALELLGRVVRDELPSRLADRLTHAAGRREPTGELFRLWRILGRVLEQRSDGVESWAGRDIVPMTGEDPTSIETCRHVHEEGCLFAATAKTPLVAALRESGRRIVQASPNSGIHKVLKAQFELDVPLASDAFVFAVTGEAERAGASALRDAFEDVLEQLGARPAWVGFGEVHGHESRDRERVCLLLEDRRIPHSVDQLPPSGIDAIRSARDVVLNLSHELVEHALDVARSEPEWAAMTLLAAMCESGRLSGEDVSAAVAASSKARRERRSL